MLCIEYSTTVKYSTGPEISTIEKFTTSATFYILRALESTSSNPFFFPRAVIFGLEVVQTRATRRLKAETLYFPTLKCIK